MTQVQTFKLPDVGEGLTEAEIVQWRVKIGDRVAINDVLVDIETAKSLVELPSPYSGVVDRLLVGEGQVVEVGTEIISIAPIAAGEDAGGGSPQETASPEPETNATNRTEPEVQPQALVGSGPKADPDSRRRRKLPSSSQELVRPPGMADANPGNDVSTLGVPKRVLAKPPVRKKAKSMGIDLAEVPGTGPKGRVTYEDLTRYISSKPTADPKLFQPVSAAGSEAEREFWASAGQDRIERIPVKGVRKVTAQAMVESAFTAPHVSIFVDVDASRTMEFVKRLKASRDFEGIKVSPLLILAKAVIWAAARNPAVNATWTDDEILVHRYINLGIAAATPRGLLVPNIKDAQELTVKELAIAVNDLASTARAGKTQPAQMQGGTLTITNIGALGIDTGTPIINPGEVAIIAFGTIKQKPWVLDGEVIPRWITTLGGSFDHRVVDGDLSARFMADVAAILEEPALLLE